MPSFCMAECFIFALAKMKNAAVCAGLGASITTE